ncbi:aldehyde reductase ii [Diplodia corticola]|uniref:Aldehyde reductase ii n=1 Tax=Diplodia corticola TaxID=236234 RepID=A0A1J9R3A4_9PEZI|nr:aldehyde reductase ii [Diplodia corticola]OJD35910.1 aldehyde reductase ii [Diplodia corticola]
MASIRSTAIAPGATVLVTGVNGFVGSHVANQLLEHGYRVRGTVREIQKSNWMVDFFEKSFGPGLFELVEVQAMTNDGAFDEALSGVAGVIHVASPVSLDPDPSKVIPIAVDSTLNILKSAAREKTVKRFVLTSSSSAVTVAKPNERAAITKDTWNEEAVQMAGSLPHDLSDLEKGFIVYAASKVKGEQAMWEWVKPNEPSLVVNSVVPGGNFGRILSPENQGFPSTTMLAAALYNSDEDLIKTFVTSYPPEWFVDVQDNGRLHVAALTHPDVCGERVFACASPYNWNDVLSSLRELYPAGTFMDYVAGLWDDLTTFYGIGYPDFEIVVSFVDNFGSIYDAEKFYTG